MAASPTRRFIPRSTETVLNITKEVVSLLQSADETVGVAESLTGGGLMKILSSVPGSGTTFRGGVVSYATPLKQNLLHVDPDLVAKEGVIHPDVAAQMAEGARRVTTCDDVPTTWGIATTGVAGPEEQDGKPVGTVFIGIASPEGSQGLGPFSFPGSREHVCESTVAEALSKLREALLARKG